MPPTYYQIELSPRWLTALLVLLALLLVVAFVFGYGAAWSVFTAHHGDVPDAVGAAVLAEPTPTPETETVTIEPRATGAAVAPPTMVAPSRPPPSASASAARSPQPQPVTTVAPARGTTEPSAEGYWVQVLAASQASSIDRARTKVEEIGFPRDHQHVVEAPVAGGGTLYKLRVGPFPDRASADRVILRIRDAGFPDAWVVVP